MKRNCPSPKKSIKAQTPPASPEIPEPVVLHLKPQGQEMSICMLVLELEVCAILDSGAIQNALFLLHYNAIHPDVRPSLQPSPVKTVLGVGPGDIPVLGEAYVLV